MNYNKKLHSHKAKDTSVKLVCYFSLVCYVTRPNLCSPILNWFMFDLRSKKIGMCSLECVDDDRVLGSMI